MDKNHDKEITTAYQKHRFILDILSKIILNLLSSGLLFGLGFWLLTPIWFFWSTIRYGYCKYRNYQTYQHSNRVT